MNITVSVPNKFNSPFNFKLNLYVFIQSINLTKHLD